MTDFNTRRISDQEVEKAVAPTWCLADQPCLYGQAAQANPPVVAAVEE